MRQSISIDNHSGFHFTVLRTSLAGGLLGLLHGLVAPSTSYFADPAGLSGSWSFFYGASAVALLGGAAVLPVRSGQRALLGLAVVLGGLSTALSAKWAGSCCALTGPIGLAVALGMYLASGGLSRGQAALAAVLSAVATFAAQKIGPALSAQDFMLELPDRVSPLLAGLGTGLVVGSATIARHLKLKVNVVDKELQGLLPAAGADDEIAKLVTQAMTSYEQAAECLDEHLQARQMAEQLIKKIARFGKKWQEIEAQTRKGERAQLEQRIAELQGRKDAATDDSVRTEYERALVALREQLSYLGEIEKGLARAVARLHHQVATLDRLRLAALRHRSAGAAKFGEELKTVVDELQQAGQELDIAAEVLTESPN
jgi:hypothetical protein